MHKSLTKMKAIPNMPDEIKNAIDNNTLYIFVGAGVSRLYGYPSWEQLGKNLISTAVKLRVMSRSEKATLLSGDFSPMQYVTIAYNCLKKGTSKTRAQKLIISELELERQKGYEDKVTKICNYLFNYHSPIITTNADKSLDTSKAFTGKNIIYNFAEWDGNNDFNILYHLHGSIDKFESMVFTSEQYARAYMNEARFGENLKKLFGSDRTILFIGYGMNEFELLRYFLKPSKLPNKPNLFMLSGYLDRDFIKYKFDKTYFKSLGIDVLYFSIEKYGYDALINVLEKWNKVVSLDTNVSLNISKEIKKAAESAPSLKTKKIIEDCFNYG